MVAFESLEVVPGDITEDLIREYVEFGNKNRMNKEATEPFSIRPSYVDAFKKLLAENAFNEITQLLDKHALMKKSVTLFIEFIAARKSVDNFNHIMQSVPLALIDFWSEGCVPCMSQAEILENGSNGIKDKFPSLQIYKMNTSHDGGISDRLGIQYIPTLAIIHNKKIHLLKSGPREIEDIAKVIESIIN